MSVLLTSTQFFFAYANTAFLQIKYRTLLFALYQRESVAIYSPLFTSVNLIFFRQMR